jgi:mannosyltransferase OCH1-like enzyme
LGGALPRRYKQWCESWITLNSRYTYKLWTDRDVCFRSKDLYNIFLKTTNIGAKSDILRYEILDRYGGFYCDTDLECVKDFDGLFLNTSFAACSLFSMEPHFGNGFIACSPGHPIIRSIIKSIKTPITTRDVIEIIDTIGPGLLTKKCLEYIDSSFDQSCALLPSNYVYPWPNYLRSDNLSPKKYLTATSIGIHYWEMSWTEKGLSRLFRRYIRNPIRKLAKILVSCVGLGR